MIPLPYKILISLAAIAAIWLTYSLWRHKVYQEGYQACQTDQTKAIEKGDKKYEKAIPKNRTRSDADLRKSVCLGVYDSDYDTCVKSLPDFTR